MTSQQLEHLEGTTPQGRPRESAGSTRDHVLCVAAQTEPVAGDRGVCRDDAVQPLVPGQVRDREDVLVREVRGDLDEQRHVPRRDPVRFLPHGSQQRSQRVEFLELA